jgi:hypothetical protein
MIPVDLHELEVTIESEDGESDFSTISLEGRHGSQMGYFSPPKIGLLEPI